ncbi:MAG: outer membrane protein assembly factor BamE [Methylobacter sp.]|jgi:outer membrane protein assembly factor BamE|nr:outer membrane protein assembly factor BamE [Methylobacter sp.]
MRKPLFALNLSGSRYTSCILAVAVSLTLASCTTILTNLPGVYTIDVQQGNIVDQSMIDQLRPDMNKRQVLYIMGSPMLVDFFHKSRWDYLYSAQTGGGDREQKRISLYFDKDQLIGVQGDFKPSTVPVIKTSDETTVDVPKRDLEKTLWEMITGLFGFDGVDDTPTTDKSKPAPDSSKDQLPL